jgi:predicted flap endonuclease-1-like 5' DNA nuclease
MSFLLAKISILLLLAAGLGALLAHWWLRRHYEDVTTDYTRLSDETKRWRDGLEDRLEQRLVQRLAVDLGPIMGSLESVQAAVRGIDMSRPVAPDLTPVLELLHKQLDEVQLAVRAIHLAAPTDVDLAPVLRRMDALELAVSAIRIPPAAQAVDLQPLETRLAGMDAALRGIVIPAPVHTPVDLEPLLQRLSGIEGKLQETHTRLDQLATTAPPTAQPPAPAVAPQPTLPPAATVRPGSRNLLMQASYGRADNLRLIKGVAAVLEKMLHGIGVYYFWQIADWTPEDIAHADAQLSAFKGRILRDDWKSQARRFAQAPDAARKPEGF